MVLNRGEGVNMFQGAREPLCALQHGKFDEQKETNQ